MGDFLCAVVDVVADRVPAVKPQSAFFEVLGASGVAQWERREARRAAGLLVVGDVKRGDIGSTAAAYAEAFLTGTWGTDPDTLCDAVTVNPLLGHDSITPSSTPASAPRLASTCSCAPEPRRLAVPDQGRADPHRPDRGRRGHVGEGLIGSGGLSSVGGRGGHPPR